MNGRTLVRIISRTRTAIIAKRRLLAVLHDDRLATRGGATLAPGVTMTGRFVQYTGRRGFGSQEW